MLQKVAVASVAAALATGVVLTAGVTPATAQLKEFKYSSWTPPPAPNNRFGTVPMFDAIEKELKGTPDEMVIRNFMGGQLFNNRTTLAGVRDGAVDAGVTVPVFNPGELKAHITTGALQQPTRDGYSAAAASTETLLMGCPECVADYAKNNALTLGVYASAPYYLQCNFEAKNINDFKGRKSAEGNPMFARFAAKLGMSGVQMGPADYLQALQRGTAECIFGPLDWLNAYSLKDVVKTVVTDVHHGVVPAVSMMTVNKNSWAKLSDGQRKAFLKHMPDAIMRVVHGYYVDEKRGMDDAKAKGTQFVKLGPEYVKLWEDFKVSDVQTVIDDAKKRGVSNPEGLVKTSIDNLRKWEKIVDEIGQDPNKVANEMRARIFDKVKF
jgi:TRAP-type C4-dicarboxylate transport system substrate-binding protein